MKHTLTLLVALLSAPMPAIMAAGTAETNSAAPPKFVAPTVSPMTGEKPTVAPIENETPAQRDARLAWWREAKFGLFIHWGIYSVPAGSYNGRLIDKDGAWIMDRGNIPVATYAAYAKQFNPVRFDATEWVRVAKGAGMKYIVITSKHHDGFAMFPSKVSDFNIRDATPFPRDPLAELSAECRKEGLRFGLYYSQAMDWHNPGGQPPKKGWWDPAQHGDMMHFIRTTAAPQVREILSNYGPIAELWFDMAVNMNSAMADEILAVVKATQPNVMINNRLGGGFKGDFNTPEQYIPSTGYPGRDWETCMTINETWGFKNQDTNWKSAADLIRKLVDICHKGGNFLLNVGPDAQGIIPPACVERLAAIGAWVGQNGEAIYGTTASPIPFLSWGRCTRRGDALYFHVFDWPADGELRIPMQAKVTGAHLLAKPNEPLACEQHDGGLIVRLPKDPTDAVASVIRLTIVGEPVVEPPPQRGKPIRSSRGNPASAFDGDPGRSWEEQKGQRDGWIEVDLLKPTPIHGMAIDEPHRGAGKRGQKYRLRMRAVDQWKEVVAGETEGYGATRIFPTVTGRVFRLEIFESKDTAAVSELQLYRPE